MHAKLAQICYEYCHSYGYNYFGTQYKDEVRRLVFPTHQAQHLSVVSIVTTSYASFVDHYRSLTPHPLSSTPTRTRFCPIFLPPYPPFPPPVLLRIPPGP